MAESTVPLAYNEYLPENPPIIFLHGLSNSKETWQGIVQVIVQKTGCKAYTLDARNHGDSSWSETIGYGVMADDLLRFMDSVSIDKAIIVGHSMGGKIGYSFALKYPERLHLLIVEDISLHSSSSSKGMLFKYFQMLREVIHKIPLGVELDEARKFVASQIRQNEDEDGEDIPIRRKSDGGFEWKTNLDVLEDALKNNRWKPVDAEPTYNGPVLIIYGTLSPYKVLADKENLLKQFPKAIYKPIEEGGHSLHKDFTDIFIQLVCDFISNHRKIEHVTVDSIHNNRKSTL